MAGNIKTLRKLKTLTTLITCLLFGAWILVNNTTLANSPQPNPPQTKSKTAHHHHKTKKPDPVRLKPGHPNRYVVKQGDTLWDIAETFLEKPWHWKQLWRANPQIDDPNRIYPGDILVLHLRNGEPVLKLDGNNGTHTIKLSPRIHQSKIDDAIPTIPLSSIKPFLNETLVVEEGSLDDLPYVIASADTNLLITPGQQFYARGFKLNNAAQEQEMFTIFREGEPFRDPDTKKILGFAATHIGQALLEKANDPATLLLISSNQDVRVGDHLKDLENEALSPFFEPQAPDVAVNGKIVSVLGGVTQVGKYNVVVINQGQNGGLAIGDVLSVVRTGKRAIDEKAKRSFFDRMFFKKPMIQLPDKKSGELIIFRVFENLSFGLIMNASDVIHVGDGVREP